VPGWTTFNEGSIVLRVLEEDVAGVDDDIGLRVEDFVNELEIAVEWWCCVVDLSAVLFHLPDDDDDDDDDDEDDISTRARTDDFVNVK